MIGFPFIVWRAVVAHRQAETAQQDMITDRINKAVENLGATRVVREKTLKLSNASTPTHGAPTLGAATATLTSYLSGGAERDTHVENERLEPNLEVRIGAIYALERIAYDDLSFHIQIMEILTTYVRKNSAEKTRGNSSRPREDIQAIITVIGRRSEKQVRIEQNDLRKSALGYSPDLRGCNLQGIDFSYLNFSRCRFTDSAMERTNFFGAKIDKTVFAFCSLSGSTFRVNSAKGAQFYGADLSGHNTQIGEEIIKNAFLLTTNLHETNLRGLPIPQEVIDLCFGSEATGLPKALDIPPHWSFALYDKRPDYYSEWIKFRNNAPKYIYESATRAKRGHTT
ncbi:pentapeptide repeat-containing protein [Aliiroseovarius crassostreae]|uniref:pentapeptide repeat-containing protein n=1 Tax=Aliiroseovarius crassostreae TaxID=154981 RepID=UPI00220480F9|nr:pentapeptide repeat-containing protein [Aliiroseovarius crassostreae]UWQ05472.1 pentapeptide repeat-containing protein [Aliiroseovarius crassostreae]